MWAWQGQATAARILSRQASLIFPFTALVADPKEEESDEDAKDQPHPDAASVDLACGEDHAVHYPILCIISCIRLCLLQVSQR